jgi:hypothetical protein
MAERLKGDGAARDSRKTLGYGKGFSRTWRTVPAVKERTTGADRVMATRAAEDILFELFVRNACSVVTGSKCVWRVAKLVAAVRIAGFWRLVHPTYMLCVSIRIHKGVIQLYMLCSWSCSLKHARANNYVAPL